MQDHVPPTEVLYVFYFLQFYSNAHFSRNNADQTVGNFGCLQWDSGSRDSVGGGGGGGGKGY